MRVWGEPGDAAGAGSVLGIERSEGLEELWLLPLDTCECPRTGCSNLR